MDLKGKRKDQTSPLNPARNLALHNCEVNNHDFTKKDLSDAEIDYTEFNEVIFDNAKLRRSQIIATFRECSFKEGDLLGADLSWCVFENCDFTKADFRGVIIADATFNYCIMHDARLQDTDAQGAKFNACDFTGARFQNFELQYGKLEGCVMKDTIMVGCDLLGAEILDTTGKPSAFDKNITRLSKGMEELYAND